MAENDNNALNDFVQAVKSNMPKEYNALHSAYVDQANMQQELGQLQNGQTPESVADEKIKAFMDKQPEAEKNTIMTGGSWMAGMIPVEMQMEKETQAVRHNIEEFQPQIATKHKQTEALEAIVGKDDFQQMIAQGDIATLKAEMGKDKHSEASYKAYNDVLNSTGLTASDADKGKMSELLGAFGLDTVQVGKFADKAVAETALKDAYKAANYHDPKSIENFKKAEKEFYVRTEAASGEKIKYSDETKTLASIGIDKKAMQEKEINSEGLVDAKKEFKSAFEDLDRLTNTVGRNQKEYDAAAARYNEAATGLANADEVGLNKDGTFDFNKPGARDKFKQLAVSALGDEEKFARARALYKDERKEATIEIANGAKGEVLENAIGRIAMTDATQKVTEGRLQDALNIADLPKEQQDKILAQAESALQGTRYQIADATHVPPPPSTVAKVVQSAEPGMKKPSGGVEL